MGCSVLHIAYFGDPGVNLPIYKEQLCEAKDIYVAKNNNNKNKTSQNKNTSSILHLALSLGPIILSSPLCIALGNRYGPERILKSFSRIASHCQKTAEWWRRDSKTLLSSYLHRGAKALN